MIPITDESWSELVSTVEPYMAADGDVKEISVGMNRVGGIKCVVSDPVPSLSPDVDISEVENIPRNESVVVTGGPAYEIKRKVSSKLLEGISSVPSDASIMIKNILVVEEGIRSQYEIRRGLPISGRSDTMYKQLAESLVESGHIDSVDEFSHGSLQIWERGDNLYSVEGTFYRYTEEPYNYWKEMEDMEDWVEFASESEADKERIRNQDKHLVHFHPMGLEAERDSPLVEYFYDMEDVFSKDVVVETDVVSPVSLHEVRVDEGFVQLIGGFRSQK